MLFLDRCDGKRVKGLNPFQKILPYIMTTRNSSAIYFMEDIDIEPALHLIRQLNNAAGEKKYTLFHVIIAAIVRVLEEKPHLNRFIHGKCLYERNYVSISFIVKKEFTEDARETDAKIYFSKGETLYSVAEKVDEAIKKAESDELSPDEKEMYIVSAIPGGNRISTALFKLLDRFNVAPASMIRSDPLYTSIYVANLTSLNLSAPYHHLYEWGTASAFVVMGKMERKMLTRKDGNTVSHRFMNFKITLDERISEGLYFARVIDLFRRILMEPSILCAPQGKEIDASIAASIREEKIPVIASL